MLGIPYHPVSKSQFCRAIYHRYTYIYNLNNFCTNIIKNQFVTKNGHLLMYYFNSVLLCPRPRRGGGSIRRSSASVVHPSVCLMSRTSALTRKPKGLGRRNFAQGYPRSHATPTPSSRSKGQKSRWGGGILWRRPSRTACY